VDDGWLNRRHPIHLPDIQRFNQPVILFVTICTHERKSVLASGSMREAIENAWQRAQDWRVGRYVIMPDHVHLFCSRVNESTGLIQWARYWKRLVSVRFAELQPLWQRDLWDTQLRDAGHYDDKWKYVMDNPVRKGLVERKEDWSWKGELFELRF